MTLGPELSGRSWRVVVGGLDVSDLRCAFTIEKSEEPQPNTCDLIISNLSSDHRSQLQELQPKKGDTRGIPVKIEAGYGEDPSLIWLGDLRTVSSAPEGKTTWLTKVSSGDGEKATQNARISLPMGPKTPAQTALRAIAQSLGVDLGNIDTVASRIKLSGKGGVYGSGKALHGPSVQVLDDIARSADLTWSIQDGALQFTDRGKALAGSAILLDPSTGLIGSPSVDNEGNLSARALIIPDLKVGRVVVVESKAVAGNFKVIRAKWTGDTIGNDWYCDITGKRY